MAARDANDVHREFGDEGLRNAFDESLSASAKKRDQASKPKRSPWKTITAFAAEYEPPRYVVNGLIRSNSLYTVTARTGHGKTGWLCSLTFAVATGREDILQRKVEQGRVAYIAAEKPDETRMRMMVTAYHFGIDLVSLTNSLVVLDQRMKPEEMVASLAAISSNDNPLALVIGDTLAAMYDGDDFNNTKQLGEYMRRLRGFQALPGAPAMLVATHPVKNASADNLTPHGAGTALNEVDGNFTMWLSNGISTLHWQGKLRGLDFAPLPYRFVTVENPEVKDPDGNAWPLPVCIPTTPEAADEREASLGRTQMSVLCAIHDLPGATRKELELKSGVHGGSFSRAVSALKQGGFIREGADKRWHLTKAGEREIS